MNHDRILFPALLALLALAGCGGGGDGSAGPGPGIDDPDQVYVVPNPGLPETYSLAPEDLGDGLPVSTPDAEGLDSLSLSAAMRSLETGVYSGVDSMVIVRHGRLVAEGYFNGWGRDSLHEIRSSAKSVISALTGIAIDQELLGPGDLVSAHIAGFESHSDVDARKRAIRVSHLLHMNAGLDCNDWNANSPGHEERMYRKPDWVKFILDLPMRADPGGAPSYCTGGVIVLGHIVAQRSGMALDDFASAYLFGPLGITQSHWRRDPQGNATGGAGMRLRPRDAAKFGQLYLNGGTWNGARILGEEWVIASRRSEVAFNSDGYGYLWWKRNFTAAGNTVQAVYASGNGGNFIFTFPALELVVVFTGSNYNSPAGDQPFRILADRILPALR